MRCHIPTQIAPMPSTCGEKVAILKNPFEVTTSFYDFSTKRDGYRLTHAVIEMAETIHAWQVYSSVLLSLIVNMQRSYLHAPDSRKTYKCT